MRKNRKSTYLIIVLICLIIFNLGSSFIKFRQNSTSNPKKDGIIKSTFTKGIKSLFGKVFNIGGSRDTDTEIEGSIDGMEDFIIIETLDEYEDFIKVKDSPGDYNLDDIPEPVNVKKIKFEEDKPYMFFYHTHTTEGYKPFEKKNSYYNSNNDKNVVKVGDTISKVLEAKDHNVEHNTKVHSEPSFNQSYSRSLNTVNKAKEDEENLKFFFDIHRDGIDENKLSKSAYETHRKKSRIKIDDKDVATFFLVLGPNAPNHEENLNFAKYIKAVSDTMYPGLCKGIVIKPVGKYNLHVSDHAALIEVGSNLNTIDEVNETGKLIGEVLDLVVKSLKE